MMSETEQKNRSGGGPDAGAGRRRRGWILVLVLAAFGLLISIELLRIHWIAIQDSNHDFGCRVSRTVDCGAAARSREALLLGVPTPVWGILTYLLVLGLAAARLWKKNRVGDYVLPIALWCVLYSAYLAYVSAFLLKIFCAYCAGLYFVNLGLLLAALQANTPLGEWPHRRFLDWLWLRANPVVMGHRRTRRHRTDYGRGALPSREKGRDPALRAPAISTSPTIPCSVTSPRRSPSSSSATSSARPAAACTG